MPTSSTLAPLSRRHRCSLSLRTFPGVSATHLPLLHPGLLQDRAGQRPLRPQATALPAQGGACVLIPICFAGAGRTPGG